MISQMQCNNLKYAFLENNAYRRPRAVDAAWQSLAATPSSVDEC
jgi:hypothetical protein